MVRVAEVRVTKSCKVLMVVSQTIGNKFYPRQVAQPKSRATRIVILAMAKIKTLMTKTFAPG